MKFKHLFSQDKKRAFRFLLWRSLSRNPSSEPKQGFVQFICFNPSTADEENNDQTLRRCVAFAESWGYQELYITNLFAFRTRYPSELRGHERLSLNQTENEENQKHLLDCAKESALVIAAWGVNGSFQNQGQTVKDLLRRENIRRICCLGFTKHGHPRHPLFVPSDATPQPFY